MVAYNPPMARNPKNPKAWMGRKRLIHYYIREHREAQGLTLEQLGGRVVLEAPDGSEKIGVAENTIWRWENEQWRLDNIKVAALAHALGLENSEDLQRPPGRRSIDAMLHGESNEMVKSVADLIDQMKKRAS